MRIRSLLLVALMVPAVADAQRRGAARIGGRAAPPAALPPQPAAVAKEMSYVRLPISAESYTFISYMQAPTAPSNATSAWGTMGAATRLDYKFNRAFSATADITQTLFGGPTSSGSFELGTRFRPLATDADSKFRPYADARVGYLYTYQSYIFSPDPTAVTPAYFRSTSFGTGYGAVAGMGAELQVSRTLSVTTGLWGTRHRLRSANVAGNGFQPSSSNYRHYFITSTRLALGLNWNPVRAVPADTR
jgi:hypothetical protein